MIETLLKADRLLLYGMLDQAEALYASVLEAEPESSEAAFGLARVALERGDERLAHERATAAAMLDPGNDDAQRLASRLAEILATRRAATMPPPRAGPRPSEQSAFRGNRSMADHRASEADRAKERERKHE